MQRLAPRLVAAGVDAIHCSVGVYSTPGNLSIASMDTAAGFNLFRARAIREAVNVPVIGVGRINDPELADKALAAGDADLISFGRQHLTDPDFIAKAAAGDFAEIRRCVACNQGCIERLSFEMKSATCTFNPACGREYLGAPAPVAGTKRLWVIGAGPAGLSAAMAAAGRGYDVEIFEKEAAPGGQVRSASRPPHKEAYWDWVAWSVRQLDKQGVTIHYGQEMTAERLAEGKPDAVILAAGADPVTPEIPGMDGPNVVDARDLLAGKGGRRRPRGCPRRRVRRHGDGGFSDRPGNRGHPRRDAALFSRREAHGPWLLAPQADQGGGRADHPRGDGHPDRRGRRRLPAGRRGENVIRRPGGHGDGGQAGQRTGRDLAKNLGIPCRIVGDAKSPRRLLEAIHEGDRAGREI